MSVSETYLNLPPATSYKSMIFPEGQLSRNIFISNIVLVPSKLISLLTYYQLYNICYTYYNETLL